MYLYKDVWTERSVALVHTKLLSLHARCNLRTNALKSSSLVISSK